MAKKKRYMASSLTVRCSQIHLNTDMVRGCSYFHVSGEETEVEGGKLTHPKDYCKSSTSNKANIIKCVLGGPVVKNPPVNAGDAGSIPGSGRSPSVENGNPLQ